METESSLTETQKKKGVDRSSAKYKANELGKIDPRLLQEKELSVGGRINHREVTLPRFQEGIVLLAEDIIDQGVLSPFEIFFERGSDVPYLLGGHRRRLACLKALSMLEERGEKDSPAYRRILESPCHVDNTPGQNEADYVWKAWKLNDSVLPTKSERAKLIKTLLRCGWSEDDIKKKMREDRPETSLNNIDREIQDATILAEASVSTLEHIASHDAGGVGVSASFAIEQIKEHGPTEAAKNIDKAVETAKASGRKRAKATDIDGEKDFLTKGEGKEAIDLLRHLYDRLTSPEEANPEVLAQQIEEFLTSAKVSIFPPK